MKHGFTLVELLVAMVMIGVAFTALMFSQVSNVKASSQAKNVSATKAGTSLVLERLMDKTLKVWVDETGATPVGTKQEFTEVKYLDQTSTLYGKQNVKQSFAFLDYYYNCPTAMAPPDPDGNGPKKALRNGVASHLRDTSNGIICSGTKDDLDGADANYDALKIANKIDSNVAVSWNIVGESGFRGEGVLRITVTGTHTRGSTITMVNRISCYDIYPSPTSDVPAPCPPPGGGR